jgi:L-iditol 2-dehydrogenase
LRALLLSEYNHLEVREMPAPVPAVDEILIQVSACGICGSDVHGYDGSTGRRIPPIVMGHEAAGIVAAVGAAVSRFRPGDRVTFDSTVYCGQCLYCLRGEVNLCNQRQVIGVSCGEYRRAGAFAEFLTIPERIAYHLPDNFSFAQAAMLEAVAVALHGVAVADLTGGETVLVLGAGMIGLLLLQAAHAAGAARVFVADVDPSRLELAASLGADLCFLATGAPLAEQILAHTDGKGVDVVLEAVGFEQTILSAIDCTRKGGTVALIGNISPQISLPLQKVVSRQIRLQGSCASAGEYPQAIELIANGEIKVDALITAIAPLSAGPSWFQRLHAREPNLMKIVLDPRLDSQPQTDGLQP